MSIKITGLDKLQKKLDRMEKNAKQLNGNHKVVFDKIFTSSFMQKHTKFNSFDSFATASKFDVSSQEAFEKIPDDEWDKFVVKNSNFKNWNEMLSEATGEYAKNKLFS